jgi:2-alkyl-3-oxoalkanoate reductase
MDVFITGATGVLGKVVTRLLVDGGHNVRALARNSRSESRLRETGARPVPASLFDPSSLRPAMKRCEAVLHLATRIPPPKQARRREAWLENDRIRTEGTRNLVDVALESGVSTFVYPGIVFFYPDRGAYWLDAGMRPDPSPLLQSSLNAEAEVERFSKAGKRGIVLRMGAFYGPTAPSTHDLLRMARRGIALLFGPANAYQPLIWVDDAALSVIDSLSRASSGIYDVVDDEPLQRREIAAALAETVGRRWLLRPPSILLRLLAGKDAMFLTRSQRVSNLRFKTETGWSPMVPSARDGFRLLAILP